MTRLRAYALALAAAAVFGQTPLPQSAEPTAQQRTPVERLEAVRRARERFAAERSAPEPLGIYHDYRAVLNVRAGAAAGGPTGEQILEAAKKTGVHAVVWAAGPEPWTGMRGGVLFLAGPGELQGMEIYNRGAGDGEQYRQKEFPDNTTTHILAQELTEAQVRSALREGRAYVSHDWLCDPTGFRFAAVNNLGLFEMGDRVPLVGTLRLSAQTPVAAKLKLLRNGSVVQEASAARLEFTAKEPGAYRLEAWLEVDGEPRPWIYSNAIYVETAANPLRLPSAEIAASVAVHRDIVYTQGRPEDAAKNKLDLYLPNDETGFPVFVFIHGGAWRSGDRAQYTALGNRFAREGIGVAVPSYRLSPANLHPAHIEDAAAAFAWVVRNIERYGGDPARIHVGGHSAGGHLSALLAVDERYLASHGLSSRNIRGVIAMSGVYNVQAMAGIFGQDAQVRREASPIHHVRASLPGFVITYCQWDYPSLPVQAKLFHAALRRAGATSELVYVPGENHISEVISAATKEDDPTARVVLDRVR